MDEERRNQILLFVGLIAIGLFCWLFFRADLDFSPSDVSPSSGSGYGSGPPSQPPVDSDYHPPDFERQDNPSFSDPTAPESHTLLDGH